MIFRLGKSIATIVPFTRYDYQKPALPKKEISTTKLIIMMAVIAIVIAIAVFVSMQLVNAQNNETETAKTKVDKLIEDSKTENATEKSYRAELIQRMRNTTCLNTNLEGIGSVPLNTDILKTSELEGLLNTCVKQGLIK
jgi:Tfp pilus assembly protein FimT